MTKKFKIQTLTNEPTKSTKIHRDLRRRTYSIKAQQRLTKTNKDRRRSTKTNKFAILNCRLSARDLRTSGTFNLLVRFDFTINWGTVLPNPKKNTSEIEIYPLMETDVPCSPRQTSGHLVHKTAIIVQFNQKVFDKSQQFQQTTENGT